jgi:hypothetical protein
MLLTLICPDFQLLTCGSHVWQAPVISDSTAGKGTSEDPLSINEADATLLCKWRRGCLRGSFLPFVRPFDWIRVVRTFTVIIGCAHNRRGDSCTHKRYFLAANLSIHTIILFYTSTIPVLRHGSINKKIFCRVSLNFFENPRHVAAPHGGLSDETNLILGRSIQLWRFGP